MDITQDGAYLDSYGYIYITWIYNPESTLHEKLYIGQRLTKRDKKLKNGDIYYGSGKKITAYIKKYGKQGLNRIVIDFAEDQDELNNLEAFHVSQILNDPNYLNLRNGGKQKGISEETKQKISESSKGKKKNFSEQQLCNIGNMARERFTGIKRAKEIVKKGVNTRLKNNSYKQTSSHKLKISMALKGRPNTWQKGSTHSEYTKQLMRQNNRHKSGTKGKNWFNNGVINRCAFKCPEGFVKGMLISSEERIRRSENLRRIQNEK